MVRKHTYASRYRPAPPPTGDRVRSSLEAWASYTYPEVPGGLEGVLAAAGDPGITRQVQEAVSGGSAPGAALDHFPWARSWGSFLAAVGDDSDRAGARAAIRKIADFRPQNAMGERVPSEGGFLVPERLRSQVLAYMTSAVVRPRATYIAMDSERVPVPTLDNQSQASGGQALGGMTFSLVQETQAIPATTPDFGRLALEAWKVAALLQNVPNELVADSGAFTDDFLPRIIAKGYAWYEDDLFLNTGTGVGEPQALVNAPGGLAVTRNTSAKVLHLDIVTMLKGLHPASKASATWLLSESAFDQLLELYETVGSAPAGQQIPAPQTLVFDPLHGCWRLLGVEAVVTDHQPAVGTAGDVMLCDLAQYLVGDRGEMTVERSQRGAGWITDTSNFRIRSRVDGRLWPQSTITLTTGQVVSPLVVLH